MLFTQVGTRDTDQDTIPGRQSMASSYILRQQFEDAILYLESIREFFEDDDAFNYNYGFALAMAMQYDDARKRLARIKDARLSSSFSVLAFLCRCHIHCREPKKAWQVYIMKTDDPGESFKLVQLIAQECYRVGLFQFAAKAFDVLYRLDDGAIEAWEGKRGAIAGTLQQVVAGEEGADALKDVYMLLMKTTTTKSRGQSAPNPAVRCVCMYVCMYVCLLVLVCVSVLVCECLCVLLL
jgi:intraflagellar transport protein 56